MVVVCRVFFYVLSLLFGSCRLSEFTLPWQGLLDVSLFVSTHNMCCEFFQKLHLASTADISSFPCQEKWHFEKGFCDNAFLSGGAFRMTTSLDKTR